MKASERRRKILDILLEKGPLSYEDILNEMSDLGTDIEILSDIDNLVFFRFIEHVKEHRNTLKLRSVTEEQMRNDIERINQRLSKIVYEIPPWYRKLAVLTVLDKSYPADADEVLEMLKSAYPHMQESPQIVKTSLRILESHTYIARMKKDLQKFRVTDKGRTLLANPPLEQGSELKKLEGEFTDEFKTFVILDIVRKYERIGRGVKTGKIIASLQEEYGRRGNNRRAVRKILDKMVHCGLLNVSEDRRGLMGGTYTLGEAALIFFGIKPKVIHMNMHYPVIEFKKTVEKFFDTYEIRTFSVDRESRVTKILDFLDQYEETMEIAPKDLWVSHIGSLYNYLWGWNGKTWEESEMRCILACILSRLLPSRAAVQILEKYSPPLPSEKQYFHQIGIAREYYFNITGGYLRCGTYEKAFQSFDHLEALCWKSPVFLIMKGRIEMHRYDVRQPGEFDRVIAIFKEAERISKGKEKVSALFHTGIAYYQRGYFEDARKTWKKCLDLKLFDDQKIILNHSLANVYALSGNLEKAKTLYEKTIETAEAQNMDEHCVNALVSLTDVLIDLCLWDEAEKKLKEAIQVCEENRFSKAEALARANMGNLLTKKRDYNKALFYLEEAVKLAYTVSDSYDRGSILIHLGDTFRKSQMIDEAMDAYERALQLIDRSDLGLMLTAEIKKADLYIDKGDLERSLELSKAVLEEAWLDDRRSRAEAYRIQGKIYLLKKDFYKSKERLEESEEIFKDFKLHYELLEVYELLEKCCKYLKDEKEAYYKSERERLDSTLPYSD
jgi:tetratricopeptide (TPR) repeat protein/Fe2+ or Zn2+ uptake regulation protein